MFYTQADSEAKSGCALLRFACEVVLQLNGVHCFLSKIVYDKKRRIKNLGGKTCKKQLQ
ncbi:conserved hypothetical protein [Treponema phagedenis]|uniref:Uncharacterized protein n=1 Tax=Treponema phagedenis TaxID=162 RepID=A0A0B7GVI3_TREPH|nr:hypothetical protein HMPREF9554_01929 [Treponema phagedenis F0421]NVP24858.1 hypothetical protein [Treponema phagedenis]CEM60691.1 conserved hypothetical protein [Treponema phagedenis]